MPVYISRGGMTEFIQSVNYGTTFNITDPKFGVTFYYTVVAINKQHYGSVARFTLIDDMGQMTDFDAETLFNLVANSERAKS